MNHKIIHNEVALREFISFLPDLKEHETYFVQLFSRNKYAGGEAKKRSVPLHRFVATKENMLREIRRLEAPFGSYTTKEGDILDDASLVLYINVNPRCLKRASRELVKVLLDRVLEGQHYQPHSLTMTTIHKAKSRGCFVHFDVDTDVVLKELRLAHDYQQCAQVVGVKALTMLETHHGYHLLVDPRKVVSKNKNWYLELARIVEPDQKGDLMMPLAGCNQGGFVPRFRSF